MAYIVCTQRTQNDTSPASKKSKKINKKEGERNGEGSGEMKVLVLNPACPKKKGSTVMHAHRLTVEGDLKVFNALSEGLFRSSLRGGGEG